MFGPGLGCRASGFDAAAEERQNLDMCARPRINPGHRGFILEAPPNSLIMYVPPPGNQGRAPAAVWTSSVVVTYMPGSP